ncbi:MAG TPA: TonB-dependent hemoglobin/transferrin/lactoferrin family receptor [Leptolyngbyaceae cyanobacterium M33_DOE_097]|uniref:TonB-dependent hemoglobin/transferrin/lactoferrin family receptor n=1 Tax=Oscillatoriales cyanobacterium SpSt-418 TaxID=2282169 RepID=A0A7C3PET2_9CYAN|nr:TonB-dependent hemoglobin/transferrin/lactoferrin family receptor [Leptolyngbyaceae cyanobacterium M33_DOE_097]
MIHQSPISQTSLTVPLACSRDTCEPPVSETQILRLRDRLIPSTQAQNLAPETSQPETQPESEEDPSTPDLESEEIVDDELEEEITITGTRTPRPTRLSPATVTVISDTEIDLTLVRDLRDLLRYEPNVSVGNNRRYGLQDINIRGLGGNRVLIQTDGIRVPTQFIFGTPSLGRDYVDLETLQGVEIIKGPASALYGSDALGGVVTFRTLDPAYLLDRYGKENALLSLSTNFDSSDNSWVHNATFAGRTGKLEALLSYTRRDGFEAKVPEGNEFVDPRINSRNNYLGKLIYRINETSSLNFTVESFRNEDDFEVNENIVEDLVGPTGFVGAGETLESLTKRTRLSLSYDYADSDSTGWLSGARLFFYYQDASFEEERTQDFVRNTGSDRRRFRFLSNRFVDEVLGGEVQLQSQFKIGNVANRLTYGLDISSTYNERVRDGFENRFNANGNLILATDTVGADNFPVKDFPDSTTFRLGVYVQNELQFGDTFTLIPGLRFDSYQLATNSDALYESNQGAEAEDFDSTALSPSFGFVWRVTPEVAIVGRYARGFRSPLYSEINAGFTNLTSPFFRYKTLSNPNLEPETSNGFELGVRGAFRQFSFGVTGFYNSYDNFIETFADAGVDFSIVPGQPVALFQSQNVSEARIYGVEAIAQYRFNPEPHGFSLLASLGYTVGDDLTSDQPLESVEPFKAVVGLRYRAPEDRWGADFIASFVGSPRLGDGPSGSYSPEGYTVLDLIGYYNITPLVTLNVGVFNLLNNQYFLYSDVRPLINAPAPGDLNRYAQPGVSVRVGLTWRF